MRFKVEFSDSHFRLIVVSANGEEDFLEAVLYCCVSATVAADGRVYGLYLRASEPELEAAEETIDNDPDPNVVSVEATGIQVYDITDWPTLKPVAGKVELVPTEFPEFDGDDTEDE